MNISTLQQLIDYFQQISDRYSLLKYFIFGGDEEVISPQQTDVKYPCLVLETPTVGYSGDIDDSAEKIYDFAVSVLANTNLDDFKQRSDTLSNLGYIADQVVFRIATDFSLSLDKFRAEAVEGYTHDNLYGWRIVFRLSVPIANCLDENWNNE